MLSVAHGCYMFEFPCCLSGKSYSEFANEILDLGNLLSPLTTKCCLKTSCCEAGKVKDLSKDKIFF